MECRDGRLVFADEDAFQKTMKYLYENQEDEFALDRAFPGFTSYLKAYVDLADKDFENFVNHPNLVHLIDGVDVEKELTPVVEFELLKSVLNPDGIFQIGDKVHKYSSDFVYSTSDINSIPLLEASDYSSIEDLEKSPIVKKDLKVSNRASFASSCESFFDNNNHRKVQGVASALSSLSSGYQEIYLRTRAMKRHWWGWAAYRHRELVIRGSGAYTRIDAATGNWEPPTSYSHDRTKFDAYSLKIVLDWSWNSPNPMIFTTNNTFHDARWDKGCTVIIN